MRRTSLFLLALAFAFAPGLSRADEIAAPPADHLPFSDGMFHLELTRPFALPTLEQMHYHTTELQGRPFDQWYFDVQGGHALGVAEHLNVLQPRCHVILRTTVTFDGPGGSRVEHPPASFPTQGPVTLPETGRLPLITSAYLSADTTRSRYLIDYDFPENEPFLSMRCEFPRGPMPAYADLVAVWGGGARAVLTDEDQKSQAVGDADARQDTGASAGDTSAPLREGARISDADTKRTAPAPSSQGIGHAPVHNSATLREAR